MKHTLSIMLQNEAGALVRVAELFSARHVNIDALNVVPTEDPEVSHLTLQLEGSEAMLEQIMRQVRKLVDVLELERVPDDDAAAPARAGANPA